MDPSELGSFLTGIRYHILIWIGNKEGMMAKAIKIILLLRHLQSPLFYYSSWDLFLWKSDQRIRDVWICKVRCSKCDETMADITNFCIKCKTKPEIGRTVMKKAEDQVDNYNLVWVLSPDSQIFKIQVSELEKSANCANMRGAEVCKSLVHCLAKYNNAMYKVFFWCMFHPLNEPHQASLPDLSHNPTI